jgi:hypothetical protein
MWENAGFCMVFAGYLGVVKLGDLEWPVLQVVDV